MDLSALQAMAARPGVAALLAALGPGEARLVGGAVRDGLLGEAVADLDLATTLSPYEVMRRCGAAEIRTVPTGIAHGTVTALAHGETLEVTTLRADLDTDGRHATVAFTDDWQEDAARRDFTVNALYFDPATGALFDYFGGVDDLAARRVRFIGEPLQRIAEDHLRILRFFRFTARFAQAPDPAGLAACVARANDLMALSRERIADEWLKLLGLPDPVPTVGLMLEQGVLLPVLPEIAAGAEARLAALVAAERAAGIAPAALRRLAALIPRDVAVAEKIAARLKLSNKARKRLAAAADPARVGAPRAMAYALGTEEAQDRLLLADRPREAKALIGWTPPRLPLGGGQLIARGLAAGPVVARTLKAIERRWVEEEFPEADRLEVITNEELARATAS
ncbi:cytidine(C)-cytidine(C)-adenosine (A)]-adding enzyme [Sphingomonas astaxanthinifaciens DSM 22298]|uniref:Cytidine(C)-cytidine(C)-adenosine (A)]-adding enzyme n=2 Tax=Sphingomonas TaxID=13687 RepID=A0ABQ5Z125_9SPHN|nr:cytidine(C)-cytidine(C)-adenosine (A)]-adding enzyme [Sphingomonas astaxanthinifaciens DSM 22298]